MLKHFRRKWWQIGLLLLGISLAFIGLDSVSWFDRPSMSTEEVCAYVEYHIKDLPINWEYLSPIKSKRAYYLGDGKWKVTIVANRTFNIRFWEKGKLLGSL
jgi:hypothetical protein